MATLYGQHLSSGLAITHAVELATKSAMTREIEREERATRLRVARESAGLKSPRQAAKKFGWNQSTYRAHEAGWNGFDNDAGRKYALKFEVDLAWLMTGQGPAPAGYAESSVENGGGSMTAMVPVVGVVRAGGLVDFSLGESLEYVPAPEAGEWRALRVERNAIPPRYRGGEILYYPAERGLPEEARGQECAVSIGGQVYIRDLMSAAEPNRWHLGSPSSEPILNAAVEWTSPIIWVRKSGISF